MKEQLLALAYQQEDEVFGSSERDEFDCLIALIEDGTINTFEELARYGVEACGGDGEHDCRRDK
jgi:hypothetical protein